MGMVLYLRRAVEADVAGLEANPDSTAAFFFDEAAQRSGDLIDFDKAWQAVHFTLSGAEYNSDNPLGAILSDGKQVGSDIGYGRPWIISENSMRSFHQALANLTDDDIRQRYDPEALVANDIYFADAFLDDPVEGLAYLMQGIPSLRAFSQKCAETGACALVAIS